MIFLWRLRLLPGGNWAEESIPCGMVPFSPYMPPKTDWKLRGMMNAAENGLKAQPIIYTHPPPFYGIFAYGKDDYRTNTDPHPYRLAGMGQVSDSTFRFSVRKSYVKRVAGGYRYLPLNIQQFPNICAIILWLKPIPERQNSHDTPFADNHIPGLHKPGPA